MKAIAVLRSSNNTATRYDFQANEHLYKRIQIKFVELSFAHRLFYDSQLSEAL
jgi:hypothetical protein